MNARNAHEYLPLLLALINGETIQINCPPEGWLDANEVDFSFLPGAYRIKPKIINLYVATWLNESNELVGCNPSTSREYIEKTYSSRTNFRLHELKLD